MNTDNLHVVIGFDPETGDHWTCTNNDNMDVIEGVANAVHFRNQRSSESMYIYRVAKLTFLD